MTNKRTNHSTDPTQDTRQVPKRKAVAASDVGLSLTISDEALKKLDRIQEEAIKTIEKGQKFSWR